MRVLHITTSVVKQSASYRIHKALLKAGVDSFIYVKKDSLCNSRILFSKGLYMRGIGLFTSVVEKILLRLFLKEIQTPISLGVLSSIDREVIEEISPDIINLHWICGQFMSVADMKYLSKYKIVWTLHDSWGFTGGCHIPYNCKKYVKKCEKCEQMPRKYYVDICKYVFQYKMRNYLKDSFNVIAPSHWLGRCAKQSFLMKRKDVEVIPNPIDIYIYRKYDQKMARSILGLPVDNKKIILFGAMAATSDKNKGFQYLFSAIRSLFELYPDKAIELVVFGGDEPVNKLDFGYNITYMGYLHDDISLGLLYSAADVMVVPSKSENFPNTVLESLACATPVVAFNVGGISDLVEHEKNGYLARPYDSEDLRQGIEFVLANKKRKLELGNNARNKVEKNFQENVIAEHYINFYKAL